MYILNILKCREKLNRNVMKEVGGISTFSYPKCVHMKNGNENGKKKI